MKPFFIELKRALSEKNIWLIFLFLIIMSFLITAPNYLMNQIKYWSSDKYSSSISYIDTVAIWKCFLGSRMMTMFLPLFPVLIYSHSLVDDVNSKYANNIILHIGFKKYFKNKLLICAFLGGVLYFFTSLFSYLLINCIYNTNAKHVIYSFKFINEIKFSSNISYVIFISFLLFFLGCIYATMGFLVSLYTDNKVFIYGLSTLTLKLYEDIVFAISCLLGALTHNNYDMFYSSYSIFDDLGGYSSIKVIFNNFILFVFILMVLYSKYTKLKNVYCEEREGVR